MILPHDHSSMDKIIEKEVDTLFAQILQLLERKVESSAEKGRLNDRIKQLMYKSKRLISCEFKNIKLDNEKSKQYWSYWEELCQKKKQEVEEGISWLKGNYEIPLVKHSNAQIEIKDTNSSSQKLRQGAELHAFKRALHKFWKDDLPSKLKSRTGSLSVEQKKLLLRQFIAGLIFECGCVHRDDLVAIIQSIMETYSLYGANDSLELASGLVSIYSRKVKDTGFVYSYSIKNQRYASVYLDQTGYVSKQIYLSPICLCMLFRLVHLIQEETDQSDQHNSRIEQFHETMLAIIKEDSDDLDQHISALIAEVDSKNALAKSFKTKKYKAFTHIEYVQWFSEKNRLDGFLSALNQGTIKTSCLSWSFLQELNALNALTDDQLKARMMNQFTSSKKNQIEYKKVPVQKLDSENVKAEHVRKSLTAGVRGKVKPQVLRDIEQDLQSLHAAYEKRQEMSTKDVALVVVQKCLLEWYRYRLQAPYGGKPLELSSLDTYKSAFVTDLFYYVVTNDFNLLEMDEVQFEELYEYILSEKQIKDELRTKRAKKQNSKQKQHNSYGNAVVGLKQFHRFLVEQYQVTTVLYLNEIDDEKGLQICTATHVTPVMWELFIKVLEWRDDLSDQQKILIRLLCTLAYRTGLRIGEVIGLRISDLITPNLLCLNTQTGKFYYFDHEELTYLKIQIRNNYHRHIKTGNAKRALALHQLLTQDKFADLVRLLKDKCNCKLDNGYLGTRDGFVFSENIDQMISSSSISQLCKDSFDVIFNHPNHDYSFHAFRHTTANNLAMILFASHELNTSWNDYSDEHRRRIRDYLLMGAVATSERGVYPNQWKQLAHFLGHSSITMTGNHYLHFGLMLYADACSHEMLEGSANLLKQILDSRVFGNIGLSEPIIAENFREIIKNLQNDKSKRKISIVLKHALYPNHPQKKIKKSTHSKVRTTNKIKLEKPGKLQLFVNRLAQSNYLGWDQNLKSSKEALVTQLYANRKFEQKHKQKHRSHVADILNYMDLKQFSGIRQDDPLKLLNQLIKNTKVLDYFEKNIHIFNAQLEVYITLKKDLEAYQFFCDRLRELYQAEALSTVIFESRSWECLEQQIKSYKRQRGVVLVIRNQQPKGKVCQTLIGTLFLACLYRHAQQNVE